MLANDHLWVASEDPNVVCEASEPQKRFHGMFQKWLTILQYLTCQKTDSKQVQFVSLRLPLRRRTKELSVWTVPVGWSQRLPQQGPHGGPNGRRGDKKCRRPGSVQAQQKPLNRSTGCFFLVQSFNRLVFFLHPKRKNKTSQKTQRTGPSN